MRKRIFFICRSMNQTTQMHRSPSIFHGYEHSFSPYYVHGFDEILRRLGLIEFTISGDKLAGRCRRYLQDHGLPIDYQGKEDSAYDLVVTCSDVYLQKNIRDNGIVLVQERGTNRIPDVPSRQAPPIPSSLVGGYFNDGSQRCLQGFLRRK